METEIYKPPGAVSLDNPDYLSQLRIGLQGWPGTGKSFGGVSFKNPIVVSYDRGLISHIGRKDIIEIPFYDDKFINSLCPLISPMYVDLVTQQQKVRPPNRKDALIKWLATEGMKLTKNQTLMLDAGTGIQAAYHIQYRVSPKITKEGDEDKYGEWRWKVDYFTEIAMLIKAVKCDVVFIWHESPDRDLKGNLNGQLRPLLTGQFQDELTSHFTDWFRCLTIAKPSAEKMNDFMKAFYLDKQRADEWIASTPIDCKTIYVWQTQSDELVKCKTSLVGAPKFILANYQSFSKYQRNNKT